MPKISTAALIIPIDGWQNDEDVPFNRYYDFEISDLTAIAYSCKVYSYR